MSNPAPDANHSLLQDLKIIWKTFILIQKLAPWSLLTLLVLAISEATLPFVNLFLPAMILDELLGAGSIPRLTLLVGLTLAFNFAFGLLRRGLKHARTYQMAQIDLRLTQAMADKTATMDYYHVEDPAMQRMRQMAYEGRNWRGNIGNQLTKIGESLQDIVTIAVSAGLVIRLFSLPPIGGLAGVLGFIDSSGASLLLIGGIILAVGLNGWVSMRNGRMAFKQMATIVPANRKFYYVVELFADYRFGKDIRLFNMSPMLLKELRDIMKFVAESIWKITKEGMILENLSICSSTLLTGAIYLFVTLKALTGAISIGSIVLYVGAISQFNTGFSGLVGKFAQIRMCCLYAECYLDYLGLSFKKELGEQPVPGRDNGEYELEFRKVSFRYPGSEQYMLKDVSICIRPGERLAIVGMNGAGKTTFVKLLCRLYDPSEGEILLNGQDIRQVDYQSYMKLFSVIFQDFKLFAFPVGQNIAASLQVDEHEAWHRLEQAGVAERVRQMPYGLDTYLYKNFDPEGVEVSGGEAQKIGIARALYKDAPFVILDEPTAALDPISEFEIYSRFDTLVDGRTAVYISHRLSSCRFCDEIAVFHDGRIIQQGTHEELLKDSQGKYYEMWQAQAQYYAEEKHKE